MFKTFSDGFCAAIDSPAHAVTAAMAVQRAFQTDTPSLQVRMAVYTGAAKYREGDYFGPALNRARQRTSRHPERMRCDG